MELSGWYIYDFHEEFARQQVSGYRTKLQVIKPLLVFKLVFFVFRTWFITFLFAIAIAMVRILQLP